MKEKGEEGMEALITLLTFHYDSGYINHLCRVQPIISENK